MRNERASSACRFVEREEVRDSPEGLDRMKKGQIALLAAAHLINDSYAGFLAPLLPLLVEKFGLTLTAVGFLSSVLAVSSSLAQPVYGYLADRVGRSFFVTAGPLLTAVFMSSLGLVGSYTLLVLAVFFGGVGTAFFHPQGATLAGIAGGSRKGFGMSVFSAGGNAGFALGPLFILPLVSVLGLGSTYVAVVPGLIISLLLYRYVSRPAAPLCGAHGAGLGGRHSLTFRPILLLWLIVFLRALVVTAFGTFIPLLLEERGHSLMLGGAAISLFLFSGALGGLLGGYLSDLVGRKVVILGSLGCSPPFLLLFLCTSGVWATVGLAVGGGALLSSIPVGIVMAQECMPNRTSTVSGLMMGLAWGVGGLGVSLVGAAADAVGLTSALACVALLPVLAFGCGLGLPKAEPQSHELVES